jgi:hypothetical protein
MSDKIKLGEAIRCMESLHGTLNDYDNDCLRVLLDSAALSQSEPVQVSQRHESEFDPIVPNDEGDVLSKFDCCIKFEVENEALASRITEINEQNHVKYQATATAYAQAVDQVIALQTKNETLRKQLSQAEQAATVEAKIADEFRAECDVLRQRVAELKINRDDIAALASESYLERDRLQSELTKSDAGYRMALDQCVESANERVRLQSEYDSLQKDKNAMVVYLKAVRCACNDFKKPYMQVSDFKWTIDKIILEQTK